ncbi:hypothetical protein F5Y14DRAFT_435604 [Nemania sp. NC0429]|nr:hypothetical protein F5Y14DRAFT_435604 [Nemania sp. NC0429]
MTVDPIYGVFSTSFTIALQEELNRVVEEVPSLKPFRANLRPSGRSAIHRENADGVPEIHACPDGQYRYYNYFYPPFIYEINWRSKHGDPVQWLVERNGDIATLVDFNILHNSLRDRRTASVTLLTTEETDNEEDPGIRIAYKTADFRNARGEALPGALEIPFTSLLPLDERSLVPADGQKAVLRITFEALASFLEAAELEQQACERSPPKKRNRGRITIA